MARVPSINPLVGLMLGILCFKPIMLGSCEGDLMMNCKEDERRALLNFKGGLNDPSGRLSSWVGEDCCRWGGIGCSKRTGHVVKLNLGNPFVDLIGFVDDFHRDIERYTAAYNWSCLGGEINPSLLSLKHLNYLDLSFNNFPGNPIPKFIGSLENLKYLNLSYASFSGIIPPHLGNLSSLLKLDLYFSGSNYCQSNVDLNVDSLHWLSGLSSLKYLRMGGVNPRNARIDWLQVVNTLPSLLQLHLIDCGLYTFPPSPSVVNFTSLEVIDLSENFFNSTIPFWFFNISSLEVLRLSSNQLRGPIPDAFANMIFLEELDLSFNQYIEGQIPRTLGNLCTMETLDLSYNKIGGEMTEFVNSLSQCTNTSLENLILNGNELSGPLPASIKYFSSLKTLELYGNQLNESILESVGQLSKLVSLSFSQNSYGIISEYHFVNLTRLEYLSISSPISSNRSLVFDVRQDWVPPFELKDFFIINVQLGPTIPTWLATQKKLSSVILSNVGITGHIPDWFWKFASQQIRDLDLSHNQISGKVPNYLEFVNRSTVDLSFNRLDGCLPLWSNVESLSLGNNQLSGEIPLNINKTMSNLNSLDLSWNSISGSIPSSISKLKKLNLLILSNNHLSGEFLCDWKDMQQLVVIDLANNSLSGEIPNSMGFPPSLQWLILSNNNFYGKIPLSLKACTSLQSLDLGENGFSGSLPAWIGESLSSLAMLRLQSNFFNGSIPQQICYLSFLHILDLSRNNLSGFIPSCLGNLTAFSVTYHKVPSNITDYNQHMSLFVKGRVLDYYSDNLKLLNSIDLSNNNLSGEIPEELTSLIGLENLNLSTNKLIGKIPEKIGCLLCLETLDLSRNKLSGRIPQSISLITFLNHLNLSYNNLTGRIPSGSQLQTLNDSSIYMGNSKLCGDPLISKCLGDETLQNPTTIDRNKEDEDGSPMFWFYVSMGPGFVVGFWGICGTLLLKKSWRQAFFRLLEDMTENLVVVITKKVARLHRKMQLEGNDRSG